MQLTCLSFIQTKSDEALFIAGNTTIMALDHNWIIFWIAPAKKGDKRIFITPLSLIKITDNWTNLMPFIKFLAESEVKEDEEIYILFSNGHMYKKDRKEGDKTFCININDVKDEQTKRDLEVIINKYPIAYKENIIEIEASHLYHYKKILFHIT